MCGRFTLVSPEQAVKELSGEAPAESLGALSPRYNIAPSQQILAIRVGAGGKTEAVRLRWGLVPSWAKDASIGNRLINARAETVAEKPSFRAAFRARRCLVAADGFFEWHGKGAAKTPHYFRMAGGRPFAMAGLWESWQPADGPSLESCTIITTAANSVVESIHPRMPVILAREQYQAWLRTDDGGEAGRLLQAYPAGLMETHPVSRAVNSPHNDGPQCIAPA